MKREANGGIWASGDYHALVSSIGYFLDGYNINVISVFTLLVERFHFFPYTPFMIGLASGSALLGAGISAIFFGKLADIFGRRKVYLSYLLIFVLVPIMGAFSQNVLTVSLTRFILGIAIGGDYSVAPVYSVEMFHSERRSKGYGQIWAFWSLGSAVAVGGSYFLFQYLGPDSWRLSFALASVPALLLLFLRMRMPESEMWKRGKDSLYSEVTGDQKSSHRTMGHRTGNIIPRRYFSLMIVVWVQWILLDIGSYGIGLYGPIIASGSDNVGMMSLWIVALFYFLAFVAMILTAGLGNSVGRKNLQMLGFLVLAISLTMLAIAHVHSGSGLAFLGLVGLGIWYVVENIGPSVTTKYYSMELFPTRYRSTSIGLGTSITRFVSFLSAFEFPLIVTFLGATYFFLFLLSVMVAAAIFTYVFTPDTRGLSLEKIETMRYARGKLTEDDTCRVGREDDP